MRAPSGGGAAGRQVCVVGDGVGGLAAAALLRRHGHHPTVVVAPPRTADGPHALALWSGAAAVLRALDLDAVDDALADGTGVRTWRVRAIDRDRRHDLRAPVGRAPLLAVDRDRIREALADGVPAARLRLSKTPAGIERTPDGPVVAFDDGVRERFDLVVGADGRRSWTRAAAFDGGDAPSRTTTTWAVRATARGRATLAEAWGPDAGLIAGPTGCGLVVVAGADATSPGDALRRCARSIPGRVDPDSVDDAVRVADGAGWAHRWAGDGVALLGDAAHAVHPALAVGGSLAIEDAHALASALAATRPPTALRRYERRRRARIAALARRVAADRPSPSVPFPVDGIDGVRDVRLSLGRVAFGPGPGPLPSTTLGPA